MADSPPERTGTGEPSSSRGNTAGVLAVAALAGAGTMVVELSAVRLIAPWFGTSAAVWTNVIGAILLALSLGYLLGAGLAARRSPERSLGWVLVLAALFTAWLPAFSRPVCDLFLPPGVALHDAITLFFWGSLAATLVLFLPPAVCLGCVGPLSVEIVQVRRGSHAGTAGGEVLAASTLGSLVGTFATTHFLIPVLGLRASFLVSGLLLGVPGLALLAGRGRRGAALGGGLLLLVALPFSRPGERALGAGQTLLEARQSPYQALRVVATADAAGPLRLLQVNEGSDSYQSAWRPQPGLLGEGFYYDGFALPMLWSGARERWSVLVLGLGAGTAFRVIEGTAPAGLRPVLCGVEIDAAAVELGRKWLDLAPDSEEHRVLAGWDARSALRALPGGWDQVVLDAYAHQIEIPAHLSTVEFFAEVEAKLAEGGWLVANVGGFGLGDPVVEQVARTVARAFERPVLALRVPSSRNVLLVARRGAEPLTPDDDGWRFGGPVARALLPPFELPGAWRLVQPDDGPVASDDRNPMEHLQRRSLREGLRRWRGEI